MKMKKLTELQMSDRLNVLDVYTLKLIDVVNNSNSKDEILSYLEQTRSMINKKDTVENNYDYVEIHRFQ